MELYKYPADKPFTQHDVVDWAFIVAISGKNGDNEEFQKRYQELREKGVPIELKIAGIEFKFSDILKRFEEDYDRQVNLAARKMLEEKASDLQTKMCELAEVVDDKIKELFPKDGE
jgi:hypothetical protein